MTFPTLRLDALVPLPAARERQRRPLACRRLRAGDPHDALGLLAAAQHGTRELDAADLQLAGGVASWAAEALWPPATARAGALLHAYDLLDRSTFDWMLEIENPRTLALGGLRRPWNATSWAPTGDTLRERIQQRYDDAANASAQLSVRRNGPSFLRRRLGPTRWRELRHLVAELDGMNTRTQAVTERTMSVVGLGLIPALQVGAEPRALPLLIVRHAQASTARRSPVM